MRAVTLLAALLSLSPVHAHAATCAGPLEPGAAAFSPDGRTIVFAHQDRTSTLLPVYRLSTIQRAGTGMRTLLTGLPNRPDELSWSPGGDLLAYTAVGGQVSIVRADGSSGLTPVVPTNDPLRHAELGGWSPSGEQLVVSVGRRALDGLTPDASILVIDVSTGSVREIGQGRDPAWSPVDDRIAYVEFAQATPPFPVFVRIAVIRADGSARTQFEERAALEEPEWSPDAERLAYLWNIDVNPQLWEGGRFVTGLFAPYVWTPRGIFGSTRYEDVGAGVIRVDMRTRRVRPIGRLGSFVAASRDGAFVVYRSRGALRLVRWDGRNDRRLPRCAGR